MICTLECEEICTEVEDAKDIFRIAWPGVFLDSTSFVSTPAAFKKLPKLPRRSGFGRATTPFSFIGGVIDSDGVVAAEDGPGDESLECGGTRDARCCIASSAASVREIAELFFFMDDLNENLDLGARAVRVCSSFSYNAFTP